MPDYTIYRPKYRQRVTGETATSDTYHVRFRDHLGRRQRLAGYKRERETTTFAERVVELVACRRKGESPEQRLRRWLDGLPERTRDRLAEMDLIDRPSASADVPLSVHLQGALDDATGEAVSPGWRQEIAARGVTGKHLAVTVSRVAAVLDACGLLLWRDLLRPGLAGEIIVNLGKRREAGEINGRTINYHVRDVRAFCRWLAKRLGREVPLVDLRGVDNADADAERRRSLSVAEMLRLCAAAAAGAVLYGLSGDERALLYRFAFETGIRPGQIRALTVGDFQLDADPPTVTTAARYVKRRRPHVQVLRAGLAAELRERFASKLPAAAALPTPNKDRLAEMLRADLATAREAWIGEAKQDDVERERRQRSDFLAPVNHQGERAVFYSTRHGHGTALAAAGVPEAAIARSMHHASRATTARYIHVDREQAGQAVGALPDVLYPKHAEQQRATGTDGPLPPDEDDDEPPPGRRRPLPRPRNGGGPRLSNACAPLGKRADAGGQNDPKGIKSADAEKHGNADVSRENSASGPLAELADAVDSKSTDCPPENPQNKAFLERDGQRLSSACPQPASDDPITTLTKLLPTLSAKSVRQLLALARSMVEQ
jgi:integrase